MTPDAASPTVQGMSASVYRAWRRLLEWSEARPLQADAVLALLVFAAALASVTLFSLEDQYPTRPLDARGWLLMLAGTAPLALRRRFPRAVLLVTGFATWIYYPAGYPDGVQALGPLVAIYTVSVLGHRVFAAAVGASAGILGPIGYLTSPGLEFDFWRDVGWVGFVISALIAAEVTRARRAYAAERQAYLEELRARLDLAERTREEEARRRVNSERLRISRELHDVLAHNISMINVQAGVAVHLMDTHPEQARSSLVAIKDASKEAMREVRGALGMLRQVDAKEGENAPLQPAPTLERVDELVRRAADAGVEVSLEVEGVPSGRTPPKVAAGTDLAAYRIVQEALTNVVRHAGAATATVTVTYDTTDLVVQVDDDGRGPDAAASGSSNGGGGNGIVGMRERAAAAGGDLTAGPRPEGGFRVRARLPLERAS
jgi:signal transduction histidine kinase